MSFYKGTQVTRIEQIDDNIVGFINEPFTSILDTNKEFHEHDCVGMFISVKLATKLFETIFILIWQFDDLFADVIGTVVGIGNNVTVNSAGGPKVRRTVVIEDAEWVIYVYLVL